MPKTNPPSPFQQASNAMSNYNATLLQNSYNPYNQAGYSHQIKAILEDYMKEKNFCINGVWMTLEEFVTEIYPEDCPERTFLILKLKDYK